MRYTIDPQPKVRMTRRDTWESSDVRPAVQKWRAFQDKVQALGVTVEDDDAILFEIAMPSSWSAKKRDAMRGTPHRQKPDLDNLIGGLFDAAMPGGDAHIASLLGATKRWADEGAIHIQRVKKVTFDVPTQKVLDSRGWVD